MTSTIECLEIGNKTNGRIYIKRDIREKTELFEIGIYDGDSVPVTLDELKQLRKFINDTIIKVTYKTK